MSTIGELGSNKPMLADVNKDGIQDVVSTDLSAGVCVLNSTDGHPLKNAAGTTLLQTNIPGRHNHYQSSIYDIDSDGSLEILSGDGFEGEFDYVTVWDLYNWRLDLSIDTTLVGGRSWKGPTVGEVTGDGAMDIIITTFDYINNSDNGTVQVYDKNGNLEYVNTGLRHRAIDTVVQDVDRNDGGLNELLVLTQGGVIYCFDTPGIAPNPRARTEVQNYGESRNGASEYVPYDRPWPDVSLVSPAFGAVNVSTSLNQLSFRLNHPLDQRMSFTVTTTPNIGSRSETNVGNGIQTLSVNGLAPATTYRWQVNATDTSGRTTSHNFMFTTAPYITNTPPTQGTPSISGNSIQQNLVSANQTTADINGNKVTNIYNWYKNGQSITSINLPFDTQPDSTQVYSGTATTRDYSGRGNNGTIYGATWVPNGVVGGALYFDGDDFVTVREQSNSLGGSGTWSQMSLEFWIKSPTAGQNERLIWKPDLYSPRTINSYRVDVRNNALQQLEFTWYVCSGNVTYTLKFNQTPSVTDWHHVVCTYKSGTGLRIYVDGAQRAYDLNTAIVGNINGTAGSPLQIGFNSGNDFVGYLDEIRVYPTELSAAMINQRYQETRNGLTSSSAVPSSDLTIGDQWRCQVTPNDGKEDGISKNTNTVTIIQGTGTQYNLNIGVQGFGTTNPTAGTYSYTSGTTAQVTAISGQDYQFDQWLLNGIDYSSANPCSVTMNANYQLTAVFTPKTPSQHIFENGFESGNFDPWTGTITTTGGSLIPSSNPVHSGAYSGQFSVSDGTGTRRAYAYTNLNSLSEVSSTSYVYIADGLPLANGEALWLVQFVDSGANSLGSFGIRADSSGTHWALQYAGWPYVVAGASVPAPTEGVWYKIEVYFTHAATGETLVLKINDVEVAAVNQDTSAANVIASARFGVVYWVNNSPVTVYMDDITIDSTATPTSSKAYLSVRGASNEIYYAEYDKTFDSFSSWNILSNGLTLDSPSITVSNGKLYFAVCGSDGNSLWLGSINLQDKSFSGWTPITGLGTAAPSLASNGTHLILAVKGLDNRVYYRTYNINTNVWSGWYALAGATCDSPSIAVYGNTLYLVIRGYGTEYPIDNQTLWYTSINLNNNIFNGWTPISGLTDSTPALTASADSVFMVVKGLDNRIFINKMLSGTWQGWSATENGLTCDSPAATIIDGTLELVVRSQDGGSLWHCSVTVNTNVQSTWSPVIGNTPSSPTLAS